MHIKSSWQRRKRFELQGETFAGSWFQSFLRGGLKRVEGVRGWLEHLPSERLHSKTWRPTHTVFKPNTHLVAPTLTSLFQRVRTFHFIEKSSLFPIEILHCDALASSVSHSQTTVAECWPSCFVIRWAAKWRCCSSSIFWPPTTSGSWWRACTCTASSSWPSAQTANTSGLLYSLDGVSKET